jgi:hypothetical protein
LEDRTLLDATLPDFVARQDFHAGENPTQAVVGDFNGDGIPDLAVTDRNLYQVSILLGNGDGTFRPPTSFSVPYPPNSLAVGDFDRDGTLDLAVTYTGFDFGFFGHQVGIWLGNGDGTFREGTPVTVGTLPYSVKVADFTGNGLDDLAVANTNSNTVSIALGHGDGTFAPAQNFAVGRGPYAVTVGDFTGAGHLGVATANYFDNTVSVLRGNGDGTFAPAQTIPVGVHPIDVAVGDFNGDGHLDLAVALAGTGSQSNTAGLAILLGQGDGTFSGPTVYPAGSSDAGVVVGDFNGDGIPDVAVTVDGAYDADVRVFLGNGDGTFHAGQYASAGYGPYGITAADLTGNGRLDLVTANASVDTVSVLLGDGTGAFRGAPDYVTGANAIAVAAADFTGNGRPGLAVANQYSQSISILLGNGDGTLQAKQDYPVPGEPHGVAIGDFNGDGIPDVAAVEGSPEPLVSILLGNSDGTFQPARNIPVPGAFLDLAVADFTGDGHADIALTTDAGVAVLLGNGDGTFQAPRYFSAAGGSARHLAVGDYDGDGTPDLAVLSFDPFPQGTVTILLGNGDGSFRESTHFAAGGIVEAIAAGDFNSDGRQDLVVGNELTYDTGDLVFFFGNGDGTFQAPRTLDIGAIPTSIAVQDLNGDGVPDLAVATKSNNVAVLAGNGDGTFGAAHYFGVGFGPQSIAVADFNGDGRPDLATANYFGTSDGSFAPTSLGVSVLLNDTPDSTGPAAGTSIVPRSLGRTVVARGTGRFLPNPAAPILGAVETIWAGGPAGVPASASATPVRTGQPTTDLQQVGAKPTGFPEGSRQPSPLKAKPRGLSTREPAWASVLFSGRAVMDEALATRRAEPGSAAEAAGR